MPDLLFRYWGKAKPDREDGPQYHPLPYHCLDVAAVGKALLEQNPRLKHYLACLIGLNEECFSRWAVFFLALHDLGKFAESFQNQQPTLFKELQKRESNKNYVTRHDTLGFALWDEELRERFTGIGGRTRRRSSDHALDDWLRAVTGHHGKPPTGLERSLKDDFSSSDIKAGWAFVQEVSALLLGQDYILPSLDSTCMAQASWYLAGFSILCDWLGSNQGFFPYHSEPELLKEYWKRAEDNAKRALEHAGILPVQPSLHFDLTGCFPDIDVERLQPTPLQRCAGTLPLTSNPQIVILEDVTGAGKTEAAWLLTHRLMRQTGTGSLYFALPTMATANGLYRRMKPVYRRLYLENTAPSLVLAHSARDLSEEFNRTVLPEPSASIDDYGDGTTPAEALCSAWLADHHKTALLAAVGVGTIDQALLATLPSRHQSLRLLGLADKILIVDEVHAFDAYTHRLLCALLTTHAQAGGSAILLSATLPTSQRQALLAAYAEGRGQTPPKLQKTALTDYPLLTHWSSGAPIEIGVATRDSVKRTVRVELLHDPDSIEPLLAKAVAQGRCACWIRNTVADAREAYGKLKQAHPDWRTELFHARFALCDRLVIESGVLDRFGPKSGQAERQGRVLIATQVVEQSLDLDFDVLITDLAPVDLIIQRAGRLCRHTRDAQGNRIEGNDQRGTPILYVLSPEPTGEINDSWFSGFFPNAAKVYPHHGQLWLTAHLLKEKGKFSMPEDARCLIEGVYGDETQGNIPQGLLEVSCTAEGDALAESSLARQNVLNWAAGYRYSTESRWWDEALTPTRLGEDTITVYLARWQDGVLVPWANAGSHLWQQSAVQIRKKLAASEGEYEAINPKIIEHCKQQLPAKGRWSVLLPLVQMKESLWCGYVKDKQGKNVMVYYDTTQGLALANEYEGCDI